VHTDGEEELCGAGIEIQHVADNAIFRNDHFEGSSL
jgi:hypothetical protein